MKKLLLLLVLSASFAQSYAQCTACTINMACDTNPDYPRSCPEVLPSDTAQQPYETTVTIFLPHYFHITSPISTDVTLTQVTVTGVSGLPPGLGWTAYDHTGNAASIFYPNSNPPTTERICAKICGTPLVAGYYQVIVSAIVVVEVPSYGTQTQSQDFIYPITIYPNPTGNAAFTMSTNVGCGSLNDVIFAPVLASNGDPLYDYAWNFGNGSTSTNENPSPVDYSPSGTYHPSLVTHINKYKITDATASLACSDDWCDVSFFGNCINDPEPYFKIQDNTSIQTSSVQGSVSSTWTNVNMNIESTQLILSFFEQDGIFNADDQLGGTIVNITSGPGIYNYNIPAISCSGVGVTGTITVGKYVFSTLSDTDVVTVYPLPVINSVMATPDSACVGGFTTLTTSTGFNSYQWYNDTNVVSGAVTNTYTTNVAGEYSVQVTDANGCSATSAPIMFTSVAYPIQPLVLLGGANATLLMLDNPQAFISYQWFYEGNPIPGQVGSSYTATQSGHYTLQATNLFGCSTMSESVLVIIAGIHEVNNLYSLNVYPNPNNGTFTIDMNVQESKTFVMQITDLMGRVVAEQKLGLVSGHYQHMVDVSHLSQGTYLIQMTDQERLTNNKTLVITK